MRWTSSSLLIIWILVFAILVVLFLLSSSEEVNVTGDTIEVPEHYPSIQEAVDAANPGDTIYVNNGTYREKININKTISLIGENKETTIITGKRLSDGILITADYVNVSGFKIENVGYSMGHAGIRLDHALNCRVFDNIAFDCSRGIVLDGAEQNTISGNEISESHWQGILLTYSNESTISNNTLTNNEFYAAIDLRNSMRNNVIGNIVFDNDMIGIEVIWDSCENNIINNTVHSHRRETGNSPKWSGIFIANSHNIIIGNIVTNNDQGISIGFRAENNTISDNSILNNEHGIYFAHTSDYAAINNIIYNNYLAQNDYGIYIESSVNNSIFHNDFVNNRIQAYDNMSINFWDDMYDSGGNYWSDYTGLDLFSGPNQDEPGGDGIGDTPYVIDADTKDNYPLMEPRDDVLAPRITLIFPENNSIVQPGLILDFNVYDGNLDFAYYSINEDTDIVFLEPFDMNTHGWRDGNYKINIHAADVNGNSNSSWFFFTIDSTPPSLTDITPSSNSQEMTRFVNISVEVWDEGQIESACILVFDPYGGIIGNFTMNHIPGTAKYYFNQSYNTSGTYQFHILVKDSCDNYLSISRDVEVIAEIEQDENQEEEISFWLLFNISILIIEVCILIYIINKRRNEPVY
jgi:parallel beta-helix repeat protein